MITKGSKLVRYCLDDRCKILYDEVTVVDIKDYEITVVDEDNHILCVDPDMINDDIQTDGYFYMTSEVFMKAYMIFEKKIQLDKVCAEDELRLVVESQNKFYKINSTERDYVIKNIREEREQARSDEPVIPIFYEK